MSKRPNIVIFNPDQWRGEALGHMGNPCVQTPSLDRVVAEDGVSFRRAFTQNPVCTPSRCAFMSGWYPHVAGHRTMFHMMHAHEPVLLKTLKDSGYFVWWGGKNDLIPGKDSTEPYVTVRHERRKDVTPILSHRKDWRGHPGGDNYYSFYAGRIGKARDDAVYYDGDWDVVRGAIAVVRKKPPEPFCLLLTLGFPHPPYGVEEPWFSLIDRGKVPPRIPEPDWRDKPSILCGIRERQGLQGWTEDRWAELRATYYGMCARVDHQFGMLMAALREAGLYDETAVFFFSDHGDFTGDYGLVEKTQNTFEDVLTRVPFVVKPPRGVPVRPRVSDAMVELIDFPATVEALAGIEPRHTHFGQSLLPVLAGETDEHRDAVFCEGGRLHGERHCMELESEMHDKPEALYWPRLSLQAQEGPEHTKAVMCRTRDFKYVRRLYEKDELYDLRADPRELVNRIDDPALAGVVASLKDRMLSFFMETGDAVPHQTDPRW